MKVRKILTFKSGNFGLSHNFSQAAIQSLEIEFRLLYQSLKELPILPAQAHEFEQELTHRSILSTAAIEGNPLQEDDVIEIINDLSGKEYLETQKKEIKNLQRAYSAMACINSDSQFILTETFIKDVHKTIVNTINYDSCIAGYYRNHLVKVGDKEHGGIATPPKCLKDIQNLMFEFIQWFNSEHIQNLSPIIRSTLAHYHLALIHPFGDGNGRTARLVEAAVLNSSGIKYLPTMLSNYYYREIDGYFIAFSQCRNSKDYDITPFIQFVLKGAVESFNEVKLRITSYICKSALNDYFQLLRYTRKISTRQLELLNLLLEAPADQTITINSIQRELPYRTLYATISDRTARRDLSKLQELKILTATKNSFQLDRMILNAL